MPCALLPAIPGEAVRGIFCLDRRLERVICYLEECLECRRWLWLLAMLPADKEEIRSALSTKSR